MKNATGCDNQKLSVEFKVNFKTETKTNTQGNTQTTGSQSGRVPRISKLMSLAIHFQNLIEEGAVHDYSDIAKFAKVTRARLSQIMNLNLLAPDIQEFLLFLPKIEAGHDTITEHNLRQITTYADWEKQRHLFFHNLNWN